MQIDLQGEGDVPKCPLLTSLLRCCHGNIRCWLAPQTPILNSEPAVKSANCKTPFLKSINTVQLKTPKLKHLFDFTKIYVAFCYIIFKIYLTVNEVDNVSAILVDGSNRQHIFLNFSKSTLVLGMKLYSYFTVDIIITKFVKLSAGRLILILGQIRKRAIKMDFPHFYVKTEPVDSPVKCLKK